MNNMELWDSVSKSDPRYLKPVNFGSRKFTAIDPMYQVKSATQKFGPVGNGWGWNSTTRIEHMSNGDSVVICDVTVWHGTPGQFFGPFPGCRKFFDAKKDRLNEDAPKMAVTDGLTKALSHLGFNADVFLGEMDGNKYAEDSGKASSGW